MRSRSTKVARPHLLLLLLAVLVWPATAHAGEELAVVVLGFRGPSRLADRCENAVTRVVKVAHHLVPRADYTRARRRLRPGGGPSAFAAVAEAIGADAVVTGAVERQRRRRLLVVSVRDGVTGDVVDTIRLRIGRRDLDRRTRRKLRTELTRVLGYIEPRPADVYQPDDQAGPVDDEDPLRAEADSDDDADLDADGEAVSESEEDQEDDSSAPAPHSAERSYSGQANLGIAVVGRDLRFTVQSSVDAASQPMTYQGAPVGSARLDAELYPLLRHHGHLARVGFAVDIERALRVHSNVVVDGVTHDLDTAQSRWGLGVRYRYPVGAHAIKLAAGYDKLSHRINRAGLDIDLPDVGYSYLDLGAGADVSLSHGEWRLSVDGRYLHVLNAGAIAEPAAYGGGTVAGYHFDVGMARVLASGVLVRAGVEYLRMAFAFDGSGALTDVDADPEQDVGGAADTWFGGYLTAGIAF